MSLATSCVRCVPCIQPCVAYGCMRYVRCVKNQFTLRTAPYVDVVIEHVDFYGSVHKGYVVVR